MAGRQALNKHVGNERRDRVVRGGAGNFATLCVVSMALIVAGCALADQIQMRNGDRYAGKVLSLDTNTLVLKSDVLGTVHLPREKVALVTLGSEGSTNVRHTASAHHGAGGTAAAVALTNGVTDFSAPLRQLGANTNFIQQVQAQFLGTAGPEANDKFNEMVAGLMSGKLTVTDIRSEAKSAADQLKQLKSELGEDGGWALDGYLAILENFLKETTPLDATATTNVVAHPLPVAKPPPAEKK